MLVTGLSCGLDAAIKDGFCFFAAVVLREHLGVHEICGHVVGVILQKRTEVGIGCSQVALVIAIERDAVAGEGIVGVGSEKFFKLLTAGFLLVGHSHLSYYTCSKVCAKSVAGVGRGVCGAKENEESDEAATQIYGARGGAKPAAREASERLRVGDGGGGAPCADQRAGKTPWRARDAHGGYRCGDGRQP